MYTKQCSQLRVAANQCLRPQLRAYAALTGANQVLLGKPCLKLWPREATFLSAGSFLSLQRKLPFDWTRLGSIWVNILGSDSPVSRLKVFPIIIPCKRNDSSLCCSPSPKMPCGQRSHYDGHQDNHSAPPPRSSGITYGPLLFIVTTTLWSRPVESD